MCGHGTKRDTRKGIVMFHVATSFGDKHAMYNLGQYYRVVIRNNVISEIMLRQSAQLGNPNAMYILARFFPKNKKVELLEEAIKLDHIPSIRELADHKITHDKDVMNAISLYYQAIELGCTDSLKDLADIYMNGKYIYVQYKKAFDMYIKYYFETKKDITTRLLTIIKNNPFIINSMLNEQKIYDLINSCPYLKYDINEYIDENNLFHVKYMVIMNKENLDKLNKLIKKDTQVKYIICCAICMEDEPCAIYKCKCTKINICATCFTKISACPLCRENLV
jgi:hypothetical protein